MKKLIFCFDGTCNSPESFDDYLEDTSVTNVLKLRAMFGGKLSPLNGENQNLSGQHSFYYSGVGTRGNWLMKKLNAMFAPSYGDTEEILEEAEKDLNTNYKQGDEIYIFGFSRGAAIARMFAAHLKHPIKFIGVFDTVAATRGSLDLNPNSYPASDIVFENGFMGKHIDKALHIVSLDEKRILFQPTLFNQDQDIDEIWFPGVHSDIGGGYWFDGLSDITLQFMIDRAKTEGLSVLSVDEIDYTNLQIKASQEAICKDDLNINALASGKIHLQNIEGTMDKKLLTARVPRVNKDDHPSKDATPVIHHSVIERFTLVTDYRPYALRDVTYQVLEQDGTISQPRTGISELR